MKFTPLKGLCMMKNSCISAIVLLLALTSCGCSQKAREEVPVPDNFVRMADNILLETKILNVPVPFSILLPKTYLSEPDKRYPVVYMLHGLGDKPESWNDTWLRVQPTIEQLEAQGLGDMIYVFPSGYKTYYCNRFDGTYPYMDMFTTELIPYIDKTYRTLADREHRAVTGYSMGGFGACALALKHPELFCASAPLSMSFRTDRQYMDEPQEGWTSQWGRIFGGAGQEGEARLTDYYKAHCPFYQFTAENKAAVSQVHWYFTCGDDEEQLLIAAEDLHAQMRDADIEHQYRVADGGHTGSYWRAALTEVLPMFDYYFSGNTLWNPLAQKASVTPVALENVFRSPQYEAGKGTQVLLAHSGLSDTDLRTFIAAMDKSDLDKTFVVVPCNLASQSLEAWMEQADQNYPAAKKICVTIGADGTPALEKAGSFERCLFIDCSFSGTPAVSKNQKVYLACSDRAPNYQGMGALYKACKAAEAAFEYRVIASSGDITDDRIRSIQTLISFFIY